MIDCNTQFTSINSKLSEIIKSTLLKPNRNASRTMKPWVTDKFYAAIKLRNRSFITYEHNPTPDNWTLYVSQRNQLRSQLRVAKRKHVQRQLDPSLPSKIHWQNINNLLFPSPKKLAPICIESASGSISNIPEIADTFNSYLATTANDITKDLTCTGCPMYSTGWCKLY